MGEPCTSDRAADEAHDQEHDETCVDVDASSAVTEHSRQAHRRKQRRERDALRAMLIDTQEQPQKRRENGAAPDTEKTCQHASREAEPATDR